MRGRAGVASLRAHSFLHSFLVAAGAEGAETVKPGDYVIASSLVLSCLLSLVSPLVLSRISRLYARLPVPGFRCPASGLRPPG
ncbi:hypothetical protein BZA05DRAFT_412420 [Tricharina praecox]|uniref:uncharacterized protein n=1 Tax=Tricharina praecox TaxID=43433 RepID=UPI002220B231|nr:uncharacterized protein BZA05DRAFT_412420 [Tricharina praecox]KAI5842238.1 hypothetical protein BZA05DRAFT_412420 [Tricharina praecox]